MSDNFLEGLVESTKSVEDDSAFKPVARYFTAMDSLVYLNEDCSYRADRVDTYLTLLWHPYEERLVGIKLKGFKFIFHSLKSVSDAWKKDEVFLPMIKAIELLLVASGLAEAIMAQAQHERIQKKYAEARKFVQEFDVRIPQEELVKVELAKAA